MGRTHSENRPAWADTSVRAAGAQPHLLAYSRLGRHLEGWLFASPWVIGFLVFTAGPMLFAAVMAFTSWDLLTAPRWVGLENFQQVLGGDPLVLHALRVTTMYAIIAVPLHVVFGMALALLLNSGIRGLRFYRTAFFMPSVLAGVAVALLWRWVFSGQFGLANLFLGYLGIEGPRWLTDESWALSALIIMSLWAVGGGMIIYLAGLQSIPTEFYEAAAVDGASWWTRLWHITLPLATPVLFFQFVTGLIAALQVFTQPYVMTNGGPNNATLFYVLYLYRNAFQYFKMGYASALAWVLFFYILLITLLIFRSGRSWVHYEGERR
ncbi:MAG: sugar ABC transporter permease [Chloroflexi bacterium]|nr:sugar ABC transporter permease [Chloroflexota bacterium]